MRVTSGAGDIDVAHAKLREMITAAMPERARNYSAPLIVDTWGFGTNVDQALVSSVAATAKELNLEILTIDKGWETIVGQWQPGPHFKDGMDGLAEITASSGTRLGLWASLGNADPISQVALEHPDWIATWRGKTQVVSHKTSSLCMGHAPVIDYLAASLAALAENGLRWLLHDFETISRCDSADHDHPQGLGEDWAVRGWYRLLSEFRQKFPEVWIENCWNGGRPLDLQMVAHHDTTIGDDWCDVRHNAVAKVGLGMYLPAHWCSSYMSDQNQLSLRSQLAIYAVGGPWILMGDIPNWSAEKLNLAKKVMEVYRTWRPLFPDGAVGWASISGWSPDARWRADQEVLAISFVHETGRELMACVISEPLAKSEILWHPVHQGSLKVVNEFTGESKVYSEAEVRAGLPIAANSADGHLFSAVPN
jgi:alpha-galactosidase